MKPLRPIKCPVCDAELGFVYRDGLSLRAEVKQCTERCRSMWAFAKGRAYHTPIELRQAAIALAMLEDKINESEKPAVAAY